MGLDTGFPGGIRRDDFVEGQIPRLQLGVPESVLYRDPYPDRFRTVVGKSEQNGAFSLICLGGKWLRPRLLPRDGFGHRLAIRDVNHGYTSSECRS
jgi:hypothetical protein